MRTVGLGDGARCQKYFERPGGDGATAGLEQSPLRVSM
ncbi:MAG: hypothetical protein RLZ98_801 [Pseudomonadota bacterium]|jgi:hypothetical protein